MNCILMHKEIPVASLELDDVVSAITKINRVFNEKHLPVGIHILNGVVDRAELNSWWRKRSIPSSRDGLKEALEELNILSPHELLNKCYGLSLSDQYWICPENTALKWDTINFFCNEFSEDVGNILLGHASASDSISLVAPDNTSDGWLKKKWSIIDGKRCLLKGGSNIFRQEPFNEAIASAVFRRLQIEHTDYNIVQKNGESYSVCENFITENTELITAHHFMSVQKQPKHFSSFEHFVSLCNNVDLDAVTFLNRMLTVDFIIANTDRHTNNFGLIRNAETLEYTGFAPVYDNGTSLWFDEPTSHIEPLSPKIQSKPFRNTHFDQIKLVSSFKWLNFEALKGIDEEAEAILKGNDRIDTIRRDTLCRAIKERIELLKDITKI